CFVGNTKEMTIDGDKNIIDIKEGESILKSKGYGKDLNKFNDGTKQVNKYLMQFDTFSVYLSCTKDHKIESESGWKAISEVHSGMTVILNKRLTDRYSDCTQKRGISLEGSQECTGLFGDTSKGIFQKGSTFTTKMGTHGIIRSKTL